MARAARLLPVLGVIALLILGGCKPKPVDRAAVSKTDPDASAVAKVPPTVVYTVPSSMLAPVRPKVKDMPIGGSGCVLFGYFVSEEKHLWLNPDDWYENQECATLGINVKRTASGYVASRNQLINREPLYSDSWHSKRKIMASIEVRP